MTDRTETGNFAGCGWADRAAPPAPPGAVQPLCPPECVGCVPPVAGEVYYTVLRRPLSQDLPRGSTFSPGLRTRPAWMSPACSGWRMSLWGVAHLCKGEFFEELLDLLLSRPTREAALPPPGPGRRPWSADTATCFRAFEQYGRGMG